jgi:hypothetical protein
MTENGSDLLKICRECHVIYKKIDQKFCGNACDKKPPHFIENKNNNAIEPRELILKPNPQNKIRWLCIHCHEEYSHEQINGSSFSCRKCGVKNDFFPFTAKACENCKDEKGTPRKLPLEAKACDLCGKAEFIVNDAKVVKNMKKNLGQTESIDKNEIWKGPSQTLFDASSQQEKIAKNIISCTFTILNNNYESVIYGDVLGQRITMDDLIRQGNGYVPDHIYLKLIETFPRYSEIFHIAFDKENQQFSFKSVISFNVNELDKSFHAIGNAQEWNAGIFYPLPENKLIALKSDFFKIHIWVY